MNNKQNNPANVFKSTIYEIFQKSRYIALALIGALPLKGAEFGLMSIALIGLSTYWITKKIQTPKTCTIKTIVQHIP